MTVLRALLFAALLALLGVAVGCGDDDDDAEEERAGEEAATEAESELEEVTFVAGFKPQANLPFVGVYVAQEQGFFADEGLEVTIEHDTGGQGEAVRLLVAGEIEFSTADAAVVMQRRADAELPLLSIAQIGQTGQQGYAVKADSGIESPADWAGKIVGFKGAAAPPDLFAILEANGLSEEDIELVNIGFDPRVFVEGQVDVYPLFLSNEPYTIENQLATPITIFEASDYDIPTLGLTYVTSEEYLAEKPGLVEAFLRATLRGISWAAENRDEALQIVEIYAPEEDPELMAFMFDAELAAAQEGVGSEGIGLFDDERWQELYELLLSHEGLTAEIDPDAAYDGSIVTEIYAEQP